MRKPHIGNPNHTLGYVSLAPLLGYEEDPQTVPVTLGENPEFDCRENTSQCRYFSIGVLIFNIPSTEYWIVN
jgi:hypothetical protein